MVIIQSNQRISKLLVETGAYSDLNEPVILTSGELGIFYVSTQKLCQDGGEFEEYGDDSYAMIQHALNMREEHPTFKEVIDILAEKVEELSDLEDCFISGGQRRDWLFSGPVANKLSLPHVSLYKDGKVEVIDGGGIIEPESLEGMYGIHIVDLITEGSSVYRMEDDVEKGWVPMLRQKGAHIDNLLAVVTRQQGGEEMLAKKGVLVHPFVAIDQDFLNKHSTNAEESIEYSKDKEAPTRWSKKYLREHGALDLIGDFNPKAKKEKRTKAFLERYGSVLKEAGKLDELKQAVNEKYAGSIDKDLMMTL